MNKPDWIKEIEEREAKASPGPWKGDRYDGSIKYRATSNDDTLLALYDGEDCVLGFQNIQDEAFFLQARTDVPRLLSALNKALEALEGISNGEGYYGAQAAEYKQIARTALEAINNPQEGE